jgi:trk system potassium uptake protein TrkA
MRIVVIGAGEVGLTIVQHLVQEGQDVVVVDSDPDKLATITEHFDVQTVEGFGSHPDVLENAGCDGASMLIAVTHSDEVNMVACLMAKTLFNVPIKIARVRSHAYLVASRGKGRDLPVEVVISPEIEVANTILRTMTVPGALDTELFADGRVTLIGAIIPAETDVVDVPLRHLYEKSPAPFTVGGIFRGERLIVPHGEDHLEVDDEMYFFVPRSHVAEVMAYLGFEDPKPQRVFVIGGGEIGFQVCARLEQMGLAPRVLERNKERAEFLADVLATTTVLHGEALDRDILLQENVDQMDVVVCVTNDDATNILASTMVKDMGAGAVITLVNQSSFVPLVESLGLERVISPRGVTASRILQYIRRGHIFTLHTIRAGMAEAIEGQVTRESPLAGLHLRDLILPEGVLIGAILAQGDTLVMPTPEAVIHAGDRVVLFCSADNIHTAETLF